MNDDNSFSSAEEKFYKMTDFLRSKKASILDLSGVEEYLQEDGRELLRSLLTDYLDVRGVGDVGTRVIGADSIERTHKRIRTRKIKTLFGEIEIKRMGYSCRGKNSLFPLNGMLNLPEFNVSYCLQKYLILEIIQNSFEQSIESIERWTGIKFSRAQANNIVNESAKFFTQFYHFQLVRDRSQAKNLPLLILTCDGKGVVMRMEDLRETTKKKAKSKRASNKSSVNDLFQKKKFNAKRMALVASVYEIERFMRSPEDISQEFFDKSDSKNKSKRPRPYAKRVWASLEKSSEEVTKEIFVEALQRDQLNKKEWIVLVDGDPNQIKRFKKLSKQYGVELTIICDIIHVLEYLWKAGKTLNDEDDEALTLWVSNKLNQILHGKSSIVASGMRRSATGRKLKKATREPVDACAKYLLNHSDYLHYHEYLEKGYPIALVLLKGHVAI